MSPCCPSRRAALHIAARTQPLPQLPGLIRVADAVTGKMFFRQCFSPPKFYKGLTQRFYNWKPVFGNKTTCIYYREGFRGFKGVKEPRPVLRYPQPPPPKKKQRFSFDERFMDARHKEGCHETKFILTTFFLFAKDYHGTMTSGWQKGHRIFRRYGREQLVSKPAISRKKISGGRGGGATAERLPRCPARYR